MKKVLLTTTALTLAAGVASAEITFSGKGEAGFYRNAPTAAAAAVAGRDTDSVGNVDAAGANVAAVAAAATNDEIGYNASGVLTITAATGTIAAVTADADAGGAPTADSVNEAAANVRAATETLRAARATLAGRAANTVQSTVDGDIDAIAVAEANLALAEAVLANLTGSAAVAKGATPNLSAYSGYDFNVAVSGASDNGMTFAMGFDMGEGMIADQDDDRAMDAQGAAIATSAMTIGYAGYTIEIGDDKIDDVYDDTQNGDVAISGALGDLTFKIVHDMDDDVEAVAASKVFTAASATGGAAGTSGYANATFVDTAAVAAVYNTTSYSLGYTMGDVAFGMASTDHDDRGNAASSFSLTYTVSDALSATYSVDNVGTFKDIAKLAATAKISDMLSITASVKDDKDHALNTNTGGKQSQDVSISYAAGSLGATIATDESSNWWVNAQYDLGGGAQAFTTFDHSEFLVAGVNFSF
jgi:hypothetical protein